MNEWIIILNSILANIPKEWYMQGERTQCYESMLGVWTQCSHHVSVSSSGSWSPMVSVR